MASFQDNNIGQLAEYMQLYIRRGKLKASHHTYSSSTVIAIHVATYIATINFTYNTHFTQCNSPGRYRHRRSVQLHSYVHVIIYVMNQLYSTYSYSGQLQLYIAIVQIAINQLQLTFFIIVPYTIAIYTHTNLSTQIQKCLIG